MTIPTEEMAPVLPGKDLGFPFAGLGDGSGEFEWVHRFVKHAAHAGRRAGVDAKGLELLQPQSPGELRRVAELDVAVERQVVGDQRDLVLDQNADALAKACRRSAGASEAFHRIPW